MTEPTTLLIDADAARRRHLRVLIEALGIVVVDTGDPARARTAAAAGAVTAIVYALDDALGLDLDLAATLRDAAGPSAPALVVLTAESSPRRLRSMLRVADDLLFCPVVGADLQLAVRAHVRAASLEEFDIVDEDSHHRITDPTVEPLADQRLFSQLCRQAQRNRRMTAAKSRLAAQAARGREVRQSLVASDRLATVGTLAVGLAHEINNPLCALVANLEMASQDLAELAVGHGDTALFAAIKESLDDARDAAERVRGIAGDLRFLTGGERMSVRPVDVHPLIESTLRIAAVKVRDRATIVRDYGEVPFVLANDSRLSQVMLNLVANAAEAIPPGSPNDNEIRVRTRALAGGRVAIDIQDTGEGIDPAEIDELFEPLHTTKPSGQGTGMGLPISRRLVEEMDGSLELQGERGRGATARVILPAAAGTEAPRRAAAAPPADPARRGRVLVIDDERPLVTVLERVLGRHHDVEGYTEPHAALRALSNGHHFDLVFCDLKMPNLSGMDLYREIAQHDPELGHRFVFMTGDVTDEAAARFLAHVPNTTLSKPFDASGVLELTAAMIR